MTFDWDDLKIFILAAQHGSLTATARQLKISVATAGRRLDRLEEALGRRLFHRHASGLTLTQEGLALLERAAGVEERVAELKRAAANQYDDESGSVTVTTIETLASHVIAPSLGDFCERHPRIELAIRTQTRIVSLAGGDADIALRVVKPREERVVVRRVATIRYGLYASQAYLDRRGAPQRPAQELRGHAIISWDSRMDSLPEMAWLSMRTDREDVVLRLSSVEAMLSATQAGAGLALLPDFLAKQRGLKELVGAQELPTRDVWLVLHEDLRHSAPIRAVADHLAQTTRDVIGAPL